jgi:hypothetical protein
MAEMKTVGGVSAYPHNDSDGLTIRQYFAVMALQGLLSNSRPTKDAVATAVRAADELIIELNKPKVIPPPHDMLSK